MLMFTIGGVMTLLEPELKPVYAEDRCLVWGQHMNAVADKHGWNAPSASPEIALIGCSMGFAVPTFLMIRQRVTELKEDQAAQKSMLGKIVVWWRRKRRAKPVAEGSHDAAPM
jgi:hypothetical protein